MSKQRSKRSPGVTALLQSMEELRGYTEKGMTLNQIVQDIRQRHPERVRVAFVPADPGKYPPATVKKLREALGMSQATFARTIGVSRILVQSWERGVREPSHLARRFLDMISANPAAWLESLRLAG